MTGIRTLKPRRSDALDRMRAAIGHLEADLTGYARANGGRFVIYGSVARGEFEPDSDVDIMVDFATPGDVDARRFAEDACAARGLKADGRERIYCGDNLMTRIVRDGKVLS